MAVSSKDATGGASRLRAANSSTVAIRSGVKRNHSGISSMFAPASRFSKTAETGMRVSLNTHAPFSRPGTLSTVAATPHQASRQAVHPLAPPHTQPATKRPDPPPLQSDPNRASPRPTADDNRAQYTRPASVRRTPLASQRSRCQGLFQWKERPPARTHNGPTGSKIPAPAPYRPSPRAPVAPPRAQLNRPASNSDHHPFQAALMSVQFWANRAATPC